MPTPWTRDLEADGRRFARWLEGRLPGARDLEVAPLEAPSASGFSNETLLGRASWSEDGVRRSEDLVVRVQPTGFRVFPEYDLGLQVRAMRLLEPTDVPVPKVLWLEEEDTGVFGAPFYVMRRVEGRVPTDQPPYHVGGWMQQIPPEERRAIWLAGFDAMARIHRLDLDATGFGFLRRPELGADGLAQELAFYARYLEWASAGRSQPLAEWALAWLRENAPAGEPQGLVWGDARIGNILFQGTRPAAVLDWEMVTWGSPEKDVAWAVFLDRHHSEGLGAPRLEGFPSYEETLEHYEAASGHRPRHLHYYQVFAGFRFTVIFMRIAQQMVHYQALDEAQGRQLELDNTVTRLLAALLELPPPAEIGEGPVPSA